MAWRHGIVLDMYRAGLRGLMPKFIAASLQTSLFRVRVGSVVSSERHQENGIPQGGVLSVLLFALRINGIVQKLPKTSDFMCSLYVDDLQIGFRHYDLATLGRNMQCSLNKLHSWAIRNGFKFSATKTKLVHFTKINGIHNKPALKLGNSDLIYSESAKFLGLIFDSKLTWKPQLERLKIDSQKLLGIMRMVTNQEYGANQNCLMRIYRIYLRTKLDYGAIIYHGASTTELNKIDVVSNEALRIATGCFKSTPIEALYNLAEEMKPSERREYLSLRYYIRLRALISNPANKCITPVNVNMFHTSNCHSFAMRINAMKLKYDLPNFCIKPEFSYLLNSCTTPFYAQKTPITNTDLSAYPKDRTPYVVYKNLFRELSRTNYGNHNKIYTDGSKSSNGVGAAAVTPNSSLTASLPPEATIYSAELHALRMAIDSLLSSNQNNVIFTDSKSTVDSLHCRNDHPIVRHIINKINSLAQRGVKVEICWIPSHTDIQGNEQADRKAKDASRRNPEFIPIYYKDYYPVLSSKFNLKREENWRTSATKLREIKENASPWPRNYSLSRREEVVVNRVRSGHTKLTHGHLMSDNIAERTPPICHYCSEERLTVDHIFLQCPQVEPRRSIFFESQNNLSDMLGSGVEPTKIIGFLKSLEIYDSI